MVFLQKTLLFLVLVFSVGLRAQDLLDPFDVDNDDLVLGGDIFSDFNEDIDSAQILEDERFFRFGRFFSLNLSIGLTSFTGNRGQAFQNDPPSFGVSIYYFSDFRTSYGIGLAYSRQFFILDSPVEGFQNRTSDNQSTGPGLVETDHLRFFFGGRYHIDVSDLGTALTYANPYLIGRLEYWYVVTEFIDLQTSGQDPGDDSGGGLGFGLGFGLEFPMKLKESYIGVELLYHTVNFPDENETKFRRVEDSSDGFDSLNGDAWDIMISYIMSW